MYHSEALLQFSDLIALNKTIVEASDDDLMLAQFLMAFERDVAASSSPPTDYCKEYIDTNVVHDSIALLLISTKAAR